MNENKIIKKSISLPKKLVDEIKEYSLKQKRSFSAQMAMWAEEKLKEIHRNENQQ